MFDDPYWELLAKYYIASHFLLYQDLLDLFLYIFCKQTFSSIPELASAALSGTLLKKEGAHAFRSTKLKVSIAK
jgi:hypothetical protein